MKTTLDDLLKNEFKPDEVIMYKSDGPLRKLKILSDHWTSKVIESSEKRSPSLAIDSSVDSVSDIRHGLLYYLDPLIESKLF